MNLLKNVMTKEELKKAINFRKNLEKWVNEYEVDSLERKYLEKNINNFKALETDYKNNEYIDCMYFIDYIKGHMDNVKEMYRKTNKRRYTAVYNTWFTLYCIYTR